MHKLIIYGSLKVFSHLGFEPTTLGAVEIDLATAKTSKPTMQSNMEEWSTHSPSTLNNCQF